MTTFQRLLLIPCLSPVVLALLIATLNLGQATSLRVLTWKTPNLPIGAWIAVAAVVGSGVSAVGGLAMVNSQPPLRRDVRRPLAGAEREEPISSEEPRSARKTQPMPWPERDVRDPAPTVSVPFRVVHRGNQANTTTSKVKETNQPQHREKQSKQTFAEDDDWGHQIGDDW